MWAFCNHDDYARMTVAVQYGADLAQTFTEFACRRIFVARETATFAF